MSLHPGGCCSTDDDSRRLECRHVVSLVSLLDMLQELARPCKITGRQPTKRCSTEVVENESAPELRPSLEHQAITINAQCVYPQPVCECNHATRPTADIDHRLNRESVDERLKRSLIEVGDAEMTSQVRTIPRDAVVVRLRHGDDPPCVTSFRLYHGDSQSQRTHNREHHISPTLILQLTRAPMVHKGCHVVDLTQGAPEAPEDHAHRHGIAEPDTPPTVGQ